MAAYVLWRLERVLRHIEHISEQVARESDKVREDLVELRAELRQGKSRIKSFLSFFTKINKRKEKKP